MSQLGHLKLLLHIKSAMASLRTFLLISILHTLLCVPLAAFETDQFNLPPVPLVDIGDEVSEYFELSIRGAVDALNLQIYQHEKCIASPLRLKGCGSRSDETRALAAVR